MVVNNHFIIQFKFVFFEMLLIQFCAYKKNVAFTQCLEVVCMFLVFIVECVLFC